ncbi:MAG: hypothetical protein ACLSHC_00610 [Bilophila wadsworthia]
MARNISYGFADRLVGKLVEAFSGQLPEQAFTGARIGDSAVAVFLPEATRPSAKTFRRHPAGDGAGTPADPLIGRQFGDAAPCGLCALSAGYGTEPPAQFRHGRILLHKGPARGGSGARAARQFPGGPGRWGTAGCFSKAGTSGR